MDSDDGKAGEVSLYRRAEIWRETEELISRKEGK